MGANPLQSKCHAEEFSRLRDRTDTQGMRQPLLALLTFVVVFVVCLVVFSGADYAGGSSRTDGVFRSCLTDAPLALLWITGAGGIGWLLRRACASWASERIGDSPTRANPFDRQNLLDQIAVELPLGICGMLLLDTWLGLCGAFGGSTKLVGWGLLLAPSLVWIRALRNAAQDGSTLGLRALIESQTRMQVISISFALGLLFGIVAIAASSTPLWLWSSEFGGYDALSYHLELPKQWMIVGSAGVVEGNVYSHLPSFVEHAFLHLMIVRGDPWHGALTCQWLSSVFALTTAFVAWRLARTLLPTAERGFSFLAPMLILTLPWMLVVGTLAYNDTIPVLLLGAGWLLVARIPADDSDARRFTRPILCAVAFLAAVACGAKPTALLFTALPLATLVLLRLGWKSAIELPLCCALGLLVLLPWILKNYAETSNPVFPFATSIFGLGHWTQEQADLFSSAHSTQAAWSDRAVAWGQEFIYHGFGTRPRANEPWYPQWGLLPALGLVCAGASTYRRDASRIIRFGALSVLLVQTIAWLLATHLKSRFMLPAAMPLAIAVTTACAPELLRFRWKTPAAIGCVLLALFPLSVFLREPARGGVRAPAAFVDGLSQAHGDEALAAHRAAMSDQARAETLQLLPSSVVVDELFPPNARILAVGLATPFHFHRPIESTTVWDRGALDEVAQENFGQPERWRDALSARGYTHLLVQPTMLEVWRQSGWLNPVLDLPSLGKFVQTIRPVMRCADGVIIYLLEAPPPPTPSAPSGATPSVPPALLTPLEPQPEPKPG